MVPTKPKVGTGSCDESRLCGCWFWHTKRKLNKFTFCDYTSPFISSKNFRNLYKYKKGITDSVRGGKEWGLVMRGPWNIHQDCLKFAIFIRILHYNIHISEFRITRPTKSQQGLFSRIFRAITGILYFSWRHQFHNTRM